MATKARRPVEAVPPTCTAFDSLESESLLSFWVGHSTHLAGQRVSAPVTTRSFRKSCSCLIHVIKKGGSGVRKEVEPLVKSRKFFNSSSEEETVAPECLEETHLACTQKMRCIGCIIFRQKLHHKPIFKLYTSHTTSYNSVY